MEKNKQKTENKKETMKIKENKKKEIHSKKNQVVDKQKKKPKENNSNSNQNQNQNKQEKIENQTNQNQKFIKKNQNQKFIKKNQNQNQNQKWQIQPQQNWYESSNLPQLPELTNQKLPTLTEESIEILKKRGELVLNLISQQFELSIQPYSKLKQQKKDSNNNTINHNNLSSYSGLSESDKAFINRILTDGTSSDKLSALTLLVSSAPLYSRAHLSNLLNLAKKNNREQGGKTTRALVEWLRRTGDPETGGLPSNRKLKFFRDQPALPLVAHHHPLGPIKSKNNLKLVPHQRIEFDEWLAIWAFEDWFKNWYLELLRVIESMSHDPLLFRRTESISHMYNLLNDKPEQEQNLLTLLVNKLGDREKLICSRTSHYLLLLLQVHPLMKSIVVREISSLILKPMVIQPTTNTSTNKALDSKNKALEHHLLVLRHHDHARYYGVITLNQILLSKSDLDVADRLIQVYFKLFNDILGKATLKEEQDQKELDAAKEDSEDQLEAEDLDSPLNKKPQNKNLINEKSHKNSHRSKNHSLNEPKKLTKKQILKLKEEEEAMAEKNSRLVAAILTGLNRALPYGTIEGSTLEGYFETLFRICHTGLFNVSIQALILIQNLLKKSQPSMTDRFYRTLYSTLIDHRLLSSTSKHTLYLNLLFKAVNADQHLPRVLAFVKRIFQVLPYHQPPFICSTLVLLGHLFATKPNCRQLILKDPSTCATKEAKSKEGEEQEEYDGKKRDPRYAHAENSSLWELVPLLTHYHPSVKLNATQLMKGEEITSSIDLEQHTLSKFLDKFVYRQPKKNPSQKGSAIMQPQLHLRIADVNKFPHKSNFDQVDAPVNSKSFLDLDELQVPADEVFFHKFFKKKEKDEEKNEKKKKEKAKKSKKSGITEDTDFGGRGGSDDGSEASESDEEEEEVWEAMKRTMDKDMKDEIMDVSDEDDWSDVGLADDQSDSDDRDLAELLKDDASDDEDDDEGEEGEEDGDDDDKDESSNKKTDVMESAFPDEDSSADDDDNHLTQSATKRKKPSGNSRDSKRRKMLKNLPTFASVDQFAHLLSDSS